MAYAPQDEAVITGTARWLADQGGLAVWLVGGPLLHTDWISSWSVTVGEPEPPEATPSRPRRRSSWVRRESRNRASSRSWLQPWLKQTGLVFTFGTPGSISAPLGPMVHPDVRWPTEQVIVEVDGHEHHSAAVYASDRRRDALLLLQGYTVIRFTNQHVQSDLSDVLHTIRAVLLMRRNP